MHASIQADVIHTSVPVGWRPTLGSRVTPVKHNLGDPRRRAARAPRVATGRAAGPAVNRPREPTSPGRPVDTPAPGVVSTSISQGCYDDGASGSVMGVGRHVLGAAGRAV